MTNKFPQEEKKEEGMPLCDALMHALLCLTCICLPAGRMSRMNGHDVLRRKSAFFI
jgi:hypothetical protein